MGTSSSKKEQGTNEDMHFAMLSAGDVGLGRLSALLPLANV
jgi:hypothetical protein